MANYPFDFGYCVQGDVELLFPNLANYATLTDARFNAAIADAVVEIDGRLSRFYLVPITDPTGFALTYLRSVNKYLAAGLIHKLYFKASNPPPQKSTGVGWLDYAEQLLTRVVPDRDKGTGSTPICASAAGMQPYPQIRFFNAPQQPNTELPNYPEGSAASFNSDNDMDLNPDEQPYFRRTDRMIWKGGHM